LLLVLPCGIHDHALKKSRSVAQFLIINGSVFGFVPRARFHTKGKAYFYKKYRMQVVDQNGFDVNQVFRANKKQLSKFWVKQYFKYCITQPARTGAKEAISKIRKDKTKVIIITGRMLSYEKNFIGAFMRRSVKFWLWKNGIKHDKIVFCPENDNKAELCDGLGVDVMIEDKPQNVISISKTIPTICFNASYNRDCDGENIYRVHNWDEVYSLICDMEK